MGKRSSGGGRSNSVLNPKILNRRLESCKKKFTTSDEMVDHLISDYPDYARLKRQPLKNRIEQILQSTKTKFTFEQDDDSDNLANGSTPRRKGRSNSGTEEKLQELESLHLKRRRRQSPSSSESSSEAEDEEVSTSEDAIYGEKFEPEFDLTKSLMRANYAESNLAQKPKQPPQEKNMEVEFASNKDGAKLDMARVGFGNSLKKEAKDSVFVGGGVEVKVKEGPLFKDLGGMKDVLKQLTMEILVPLYHPELPKWLGVKPISGILLHGPPGCGKTQLAHAIANETGVPFYRIAATEMVSGVSGASEENIRELFAKARKTAPSIIFIDEIDAIASKRENLQREMERRIVTQLMTCMDESGRVVQGSDSFPGYVLVIGATNRPDALDPALRRPGRFDKEIYFGVPDEFDRVEILSVVTSNLRLDGSLDLLNIARSTPGFVGADLVSLAEKAGNLAIERFMGLRKSELSKDSAVEDHASEWLKKPFLPEEMEKLAVTMEDFEEAAKIVQPSSRREGFSSIPDVKWQDVGGLDFIRKEFDREIVKRIKFPENYAEFGVNLETGFLLYGPPGCGKTLIAKAVANEAGANFILIKGPELLNKYVGESEQAVRTLFSRARNCAPCILFFDEVDALTTKRGKEGGWVVERLLNQLLIELDGGDQRRGVYVIGATNRPDVMDSALLRPGRFGKLVYVPLPSPDERGLILKALARKKPIDATVDLTNIAKMEASKNLSGADLAALMNEAAMAAIEEKQASSTSLSQWTIKTAHFEHALRKISPSVSEKQKHYYDELSRRLQGSTRSRAIEHEGPHHVPETSAPSTVPEPMSEC